ncbi:MAG: hypothetical protein ABL864_07010 [Terricaulis sp.]|jgi:MFS family permease
MEADFFVPFVFFGFLGAVILVPVLVKERTKRSALDLISQAMARGQALDPTLIAKLSDDMLQEGNRARKSLGNGVILLALAAGFVGAGFVADRFDPGGDAHNGMLIPAVIMGAVGLAFLLLAGVDYLTKKQST